MTELFMLFFLFLPTQPYGQPAPAKQVLRNVPPDASLVVAIDVASMGQGINQGLDQILKAKFIKNTKALQPLTMQLGAGRSAMVAEAKALGLDPFRDIRYATICLGNLHAGTPKLLATVGGKIPDALLEKLAAEGQAKKEGKFWVFPEKGMVMVRGPKKSVLLGHKDWVELALAGKARNKSMKPLLTGLDKKTWALIAFQPGPEMQKEMHNTEWAARPLLTSVKGMAAKLGYKGWTVKVQTDKKSIRVWQDLLYGVGRLAVASRETIEGTLFLAEGYLASLQPVSELKHDLLAQDKEIFEALIKHRKEIHSLASKMLSGPAPKTKVVVSKKSNTVSLQVKGSGVGSMMLVPALAGGWLYGVQSAEPVQARPVPPPPAKTPGTADGTPPPRPMEPQPEKPAEKPTP